jgi:D-amino peptidase
MARRSSGGGKVYIMTDLEGASGFVTAPGLGPTTAEGSEMYQSARHFLTADVNAAVQGAFDGGASEVVVNDGHGTPDPNVFPHELDERALLERAAPDRWMPGLDRTFDAVFLVGAHAMAGTPKAFLDHTQNGRQIFGWWLNGIEVGETGQVAAIAGHYGVPVAFLCGDRAACVEARKLLGPIETVAVKVGLGRGVARGLHPAAAGKLIRSSAARAMERLAEFRPWVLKKPITMRVRYTRTDYAEDACAQRRPAARLLDSRTVEVRLRDITDMFG